MSKRISELTDITTLDTTASIPSDAYGVLAYNGANYRVKIGDFISSLRIPTKASLGLELVDNTADIDKPVSKATQQALQGKAPITHKHQLSDIEGLSEALAAKADKPHTHQASDIEGGLTAEPSVVFLQAEW